MRVAYVKVFWLGKLCRRHLGAYFRSFPRQIQSKVKATCLTSHSPHALNEWRSHQSVRASRMCHAFVVFVLRHIGGGDSFSPHSSCMGKVSSGSDLGIIQWRYQTHLLRTTFLNEAFIFPPALLINKKYFHTTQATTPISPPQPYNTRWSRLNHGAHSWGTPKCSHNELSLSVTWISFYKGPRVVHPVGSFSGKEF